jgi:hypothetical protein
VLIIPLLSVKVIVLDAVLPLAGPDPIVRADVGRAQPTNFAKELLVRYHICLRRSPLVVRLTEDNGGAYT